MGILIRPSSMDGLSCAAAARARTSLDNSKLRYSGEARAPIVVSCHEINASGLFPLGRVCRDRGNAVAPPTISAETLFAACCARPRTMAPPIEYPQNAA